ncbi:MAG: hypothetical protein HKP09_03455 [Enterobacterales bacterium]|nr:hypothetical protein [Enterobacterales bacterium]
MKLKTFPIALIAVFGLVLNFTNISAETTLKPLPVITDDCGGMGCLDRRNLTLDQAQDYIDDAMARNEALRAAKQAKSESKTKGNKGQGLAQGQKNSETQLVFLNFEQTNDTFPAVSFFGPGIFASHQFTQIERDEIQRRIAADYAAFNVAFTQERPESGDYSTLNFECQAASGQCVDFTRGILFGRAQAIDILNQDRNDSAFIDVGLWEVFAQIDPSGFFLELFSGLSLADNDGDVNALLSAAVVNQASNTGAHELGHNLGLRHHDSFGAPGTGIPNTGTPGPFGFFPVFDGPEGAVESILHTMASGASVGLPLNGSTTSDRFFSERSVVKLTANQRARQVSEAAVSGFNKKVTLHKVVAPNTIVEGQNADGKLDIREALIRGQISVSGEVDTYRFTAKAGQFVSAEFNGFDVPVGEPVIGAIKLYYIEPDNSLTLVAQNFQNFEGFDALLVDAPLEKNGDYIMSVSSPNFISFGYDANDQPILFPLDETGNGDLRDGDYNLSIYIVEGKPGNGVSKVPGA